MNKRIPETVTLTAGIMKRFEVTRKNNLKELKDLYTFKAMALMK